MLQNLPKHNKYLHTKDLQIESHECMYIERFSVQWFWSGRVRFSNPALIIEPGQAEPMNLFEFSDRARLGQKNLGGAGPSFSVHISIFGLIFYSYTNLYYDFLKLFLIFRSF